jgi:hypothetical protein
MTNSRTLRRRKFGLSALLPENFDETITEPIAARNEGRAMLIGNSGVCRAALMRDLDR